MTAEVDCASGFNLRNVLVTGESLWCLCGYSTSPVDRYLDDEVKLFTEECNDIGTIKTTFKGCTFTCQSFSTKR